MPAPKLLKKWRKNGAAERGPSVFALKNNYRGAGRLSYADLVNAESEIGRTLFGPIPAGHQREFFAAKKNVWLWYESWVDAAGVAQSMTIRYEVRPAGVYKLPSGGTYSKIEGEELNNFANAVRTYFSLVKEKLYS